MYLIITNNNFIYQSSHCDKLNHYIENNNYYYFYTYYNIHNGFTLNSERVICY